MSALVEEHARRTQRGTATKRPKSSNLDFFRLDTLKLTEGTVTVGGATPLDGSFLKEEARP